ncbi:MAG TPA: M48 family metallopeptidase [Deltaproteobacteria bacterium]|jgi:STE24 endopeptidase|nr:M48 family metallopeptidase [Deltaproteobacteria bacterium]HRW80569.1 M48 family metallopeptidase [Desulfomonilia bacterium]HNQ86242.1 M48 family metallopeptidase [Deltaproteobacteria bacterium]HNS89401.1 M48 family metallopeptidase [Deltaproteobacteria bacterium]HOA45320.1 M48 family metallopeptidase [Deltaproteobacteria bacterium]
MLRWNALLAAFVAIFALSLAFRLGLRWLNVRHLKARGHLVPEVFRDQIEPETLSRMRDYTVATSSLGSLEMLVDELAVLVLILSGFLPFLAGTGLLSGLHPVAAGLLFILACSLLLGLLEIPFDLYGTFVIERRFGFSTITPALWLKDLAKTFALSCIIMGSVLAVFLALLYSLPRMWWLPAWVCFVAFQLTLTWLYPSVIAPLFNRFEPVQDESLRGRIDTLLERAGFHLKGLFKMDASTRSRHSNAYFTGIGRSKRIVLFDTLLNTHSAEEISAVLAHELGHLTKGHIRKQLAASIIVSLLVLYAASKLLAWPHLYETFGFEGPVPYAGLFLLSLVARPFTFFFVPAGSMISRWFERQADVYAWQLTGTTTPLVQALKRLARENLANLHPHPFYAWFYYSHPPLVDRIETLQRLGGQRQGAR